MVKQKQTPRKIQIIAYALTCEKCAREITGSTTPQCSFNMGLHLDMHKRQEQKQ